MMDRGERLSDRHWIVERRKKIIRWHNRFDTSSDYFVQAHHYCTVTDSTVDSTQQLSRHSERCCDAIDWVESCRAITWPVYCRWLLGSAAVIVILGRHSLVSSIGHHFMIAMWSFVGHFISFHSIQLCRVVSDTKSRILGLLIDVQTKRVHSFHIIILKDWYCTTRQRLASKNCIVVNCYACTIE